MFGDSIYSIKLVDPDSELDIGLGMTVYDSGIIRYGTPGHDAGNIDPDDLDDLIEFAEKVKAYLENHN